MVWGKYVIILTALFPGLLHAEDKKHHRPHHAGASLRQAGHGKQPAHGKGLKTDIGNIDLFDPMKDTVEATVAAAIAQAKAHPKKHNVAVANHTEPRVSTTVTTTTTTTTTSTTTQGPQEIQTQGTPVAATSVSHHKSLVHKNAARLVHHEPKRLTPKRSPHMHKQRERDDATRESVDQAQKVKLPVVPDEPVQQDVEQEPQESKTAKEQNGKPDPCANGVDTAEKIVQALPHMQQQPLWNLVGPDVLHLGEIVDERLSDIKVSLSPVGDQLLDKFPNLRLRDLPVFCSLPKPFPRHFGWAQPLEATAANLMNLFPFHVRNTPLQSLRLEDMVLVGRRQRELAVQDYQKKEKVWEKHVRKSNFREVIQDKQHAIDELNTKTKEIGKDYAELRGLYEKGTAELQQFQSRYDQDQTTLDLQRNLLHSENGKVTQLEAVQKEIKDDLLERKETEEEHKEKQLKNVLQLKERTGDALRKQLRDLRETLDKDREFQRREMDAQQKAIANVTDEHRKAENVADALQRHVEELKARIAAEARDKERLEKENKDLTDENQRLSGQDAQLSGLEDQLQSEGDSLEKEIKHDRVERDRLQKAIDNLETSTHEEDVKTEETEKLVKDVQKGAKDVERQNEETDDLVKEQKSAKDLPKVAQNQSAEAAQSSDDKDGDDDDSDEADF